MLNNDNTNNINWEIQKIRIKHNNTSNGLGTYLMR